MNRASISADSFSGFGIGCRFRAQEVFGYRANLPGLTCRELRAGNGNELNWIFRTLASGKRKACTHAASEIVGRWLRFAGGRALSRTSYLFECAVGCHESC